MWGCKELINGGVVHLKSQQAKIGRLLIDGKELEPGEYRNGPWLKIELEGAKVVVGMK